MITVSQELLKKALGIVGKTIPSTAALPVLTHVYLSTADGFSVVGTDLEQMAEVKVESAGDDLNVCVPHSILSKYVNNLEKGMLELEEKNGHLVLTQGDTEAEFNTIPGNEYPLMPTVSEKNSLTLDTIQTKWLLASVLHAAATDESRPVLTGILIRSANDELVFATADGYRLAVTTLGHQGEPFALIMPAQAATIVLNAIPEDGDASFFFDETRICVCLPEDNGLTTTIYTQVIDGNFPNYRQIIPQKAPAIVASNKELVKAIKRGAVFPEANNIKFSVSGNKMTLSSNAVEYGVFQEVIDVEYSGEDVEFALNYQYALDSLATLDDKVEVECTSSARPIVMSSERDVHLCVLMPMHIRG